MVFGTSVSSRLLPRGLLAALLALACVVTAPLANAAPQSLLVIDANSGATLIGQSADEPRSPASLTKMMTLYLTFEAIERGSVTMRTPIRISPRAANAAPSKLELDVGDTIELEDAIKALITKSANDIAIAVAEHLAGSEEAFARAMTVKAREIGMTGTTFKNASGLPDSGQFTTARDMVTLGLRLYDNFPRYFGLFSMRSFAYEGRTYKNHNTLMLHMAGINGIKTGYTHASGFNLVTSYESEGRHLVAAIFGGESAASRNAAMRVALTRSIGRASTAKTRRPLAVAQAKSKPPAPAKLLVKPPAPVAVTRRPAVPAGPTEGTSAERPSGVQVADASPTVSQVLPAEASAGSKPSSPVVGPKVQMAKVRAVDVARPASPGAATAASSTPAPSGSREIAERVALDVSGGEALARNGGGGIRPVGEAVVASRPPVPMPAPVPVPVSAAASGSGNVAPAPLATSGIARPPSSLNQQHAALSGSTSAGSVAAPSYRLMGPASSGAGAVAPTPVVVPATRAGGQYDIQLGAFASAEEADRLLASVQAKAGRTVSGYRPVRKAVTVGGKTLQRARFAGFDQAGAAAACAELARQQISCIVMRSE